VSVACACGIHVMFIGNDIGPVLMSRFVQGILLLACCFPGTDSDIG